jgi:polysaccharide biosynthesis/export protein
MTRAHPHSGIVRVRAFFVPVIAVFFAILLSGCMQTASPVAIGQQQSELDAMTYGPPVSSPVAATGQGWAIPALRNSFAAASGAGAYVVPVGYATRRADSAYHLDAGDKLRVVVYGQEGLTNTYAVSAGGSITMPLIGPVMARGRTTAGLAAEISAKLRAGFIREPSVAVEIEAYRPFFILGEVAAPGQYPYVPNMTAESAVAIAGGFSPRARRDQVTVTHTDASGTSRFVVSPASPISPGDTVLVGERWF